MSTSDTSAPQVIINKLTQAQYDTATKNPNEFYAIIDANPGASAVTYYATSDNTQGFPTYYTYLYSDSARTTVVTPDTILGNFENGNTVLIEFESTGTGSSAYKMTLAVETAAKVGADGYRMNVSEINVAAGDYNQVETQFMATWDGQSSFSGRWILVRNPMSVVNDGTLTIQHNGTTKGTFTANQSTASTVNIETIYADDQIVTTPIDWSNILNHFYPVGSIYMSATLSTAAAVGNALGGTWVAWGAGRVPVGVDTSDVDFDTAEETGGEKTVTLTVDQIPSHDHEAINWASGYSGGSQANYKTLLEASSTTSNVKACQATGGGQAHNNLQPYITCYMYKRTA